MYLNTLGLLKFQVWWDFEIIIISVFQLVYTLQALVNGLVVVDNVSTDRYEEKQLWVIPHDF